jgi:glycosyltransferase involved in cell wall biosynthesis
MTSQFDHADSTALSVAICIGTYNQSQYLRGSIESALAQTCPVQEVWVSDDSSTDGTDAVMRSICDEYPEVRYYRQPVNLGISGNFSWVLSQPRTDLIVRLDSDDRLEPDFVTVLAGLMQRYPGAGYAHCDVNEIDGEGRLQKLRRLVRSRTFETAEEALKSSASGYRVAANCILYRACAIEQVGYYRPNLSWRFCEDWDMILRLALAGWGNVYAPQVLSNYRVWDDGKGVRASRRMAELRGNALIYKSRLFPEFTRRGWSTGPLIRHMRSKAVEFAGDIDSPNFTARDRDEYKQLLRDLGASRKLNLAIQLADLGLNPLIRSWFRTRRALKNRAKQLYRALFAR